MNDLFQLFDPPAPPKPAPATAPWQQAEPEQDDGLREYQRLSVDGLRFNIRRGIKNQILCSPTGSGKSVIAIHLLKEATAKGKRSAFVVERLSLVDQFSAMLDAAGLDHGVMQAQHPRRDHTKPIQVCSAQTLMRRGFPHCDLIIIDEAHVMMRHTIEHIAKRKVPTVGLTATPFSKGLGKVYDAVVNVTTTNKLIDDKFLVPARIFAPIEPDMKGVRTVAGEWEEGETAKRAIRIVGNVIQEYTVRCAGMKAICFGVTVAHCEEIRSKFLAAGIRAELYTYQTPDIERAANMAEFRKPDSSIRVLISVSALSRGLDVPDCGAVLMLRPLKKSFSEFLQVLGRGLRPYPGKKECIVLDLAGNTLRFADQMLEFFDNGIHELDDGEPKEAPEKSKKEPRMVKCPSCAHVHESAPSCPACGHVYARKNKIETQHGQLHEFKIGVTSTSADRRSWWAQILHECDRLNHKPGWAKFRFKDRFGSWPNFGPVDPVPPTNEVRNWLISRNIAWAKGRKKMFA